MEHLQGLQQESMRPKEQKSDKEPERLAERAKVGEYIFTGFREKDSNALHDYIEACSRAIQALDTANREARTLKRLKLRMDMTILEGSLKEELEVLTEEIHGDGYQGFDEGLVSASLHGHRCGLENIVGLVQHGCDCVMVSVSNLGWLVLGD